MAEKTVKERYTQKYNALRRKIRSMKRRGYVFEQDPLPDKVKKPTSASIRRIEKISSELYKKSYSYIDGNKVSGEEFRKYERSQAAKKGAETRRQRQPVAQPSIWDFIDRTIESAISYCEGRGWEWTVNKLRSAYTQNKSGKTIAEYGQYLSRHEQEILECCEGIVAVYDSDDEFTPVRKAYTLRLLSLLEGKIPDAEEMRKISDEMENSEEDIPPEFIRY